MMSQVHYPSIDKHNGLHPQHNSKPITCAPAYHPHSHYPKRIFLFANAASKKMRTIASHLGSDNNQTSSPSLPLIDCHSTAQISRAIDSNMTFLSSSYAEHSSKTCFWFSSDPFHTTCTFH